MEITNIRFELQILGFLLKYLKMIVTTDLVFVRIQNARPIYQLADVKNGEMTTRTILNNRKIKGYDLEVNT